MTISKEFLEAVSKDPDLRAESPARICFTSPTENPSWRSCFTFAASVSCEVV